MPDDMIFQPRAALIQDNEILYLVELFAELGVHKIRLTGGEPLVRRGVVDLVRGIAATAGVRSVTMTTNGALLSRLAEPLASAGLRRVNVSLDTLDPDKFHRLTRYGTLGEVIDGIRAAEAVGLTPIKLNAVVVGGYNENDVVDLARLTVDHSWQVRFIEMMPFGGATEFQSSRVVSAAEMRAQLETTFGPLTAANRGNLDGEARLFRLPNAIGQVGFIASVTQPFCASCNRVRLTADGRLRLCLLREDEVDLLSPLRAGASRAELLDMIRDAIWRKPWGHRLDDGTIPLNRATSQIGG